MQIKIILLPTSSETTKSEAQNEFQLDEEIENVLVFLETLTKEPSLAVCYTVDLRNVLEMSWKCLGNSADSEEYLADFFIDWRIVREYIF